MKLFALTAICVLSIAPLCATQYVGIKLGTQDVRLTNSSDHNPKIGFKAGVKYGYNFDNGFRVEAEADFSKNEFKTRYKMADVDVVGSKEYRSFHSWSYMANVVYDVFQLQLRTVTPFFGVGIGYCETTEKNKIKGDVATHHDKFRDGVFAYQGIAGLKYSLDEVYSTTLEYKYFCGQSHAKTHNVSVSLIRSF